MDRIELAELLGAKRGAIRWERPWLFFAALFAADFIWLFLQLYDYSSGALQFHPHFGLAPPEAWLHLMIADLVVAWAIFGIVLLIRQSAVAVFVAAVASAALSTIAERLYFDLRLILHNALWYFLLLGGLALLLRSIRSLWLAILLSSFLSQIIVSVAWKLLVWRRLDPSPLIYALATILFSFVLWLGIRGAERPLAERPRVRKGFYLGMLLVTWELVAIIPTVIVIAFRTHAWDWDESRDAARVTLLMTLVSLLALYWVIAFCRLIYRMWSAIDDGHAGTKPGQAVAFLFFPFINIYGAFRVIGGFPKEYNAFASRHSLHVPALSTGLFVAYVILCFASLIPYLGLVCIVANLFVALAMVGRICDAVNALPTVPIGT